MPDMSSPAEVIETLLKSVEGTKAHDHLLSALQHLLLLRDDDDTRVQYFHLIDRLITQIVLDRRGVNDEFSSTYGRSVKAVIAGFNNEEKLQRMQRDFVTIKKKLDQTHKRNLDLEQQVKLGADGMVSQLQERNKSLEDLLRMSRTTVKSLQDQVTQLRTQYHAKLCEQDKQLQQLYEALKDEAEENTLLVNARESLIVENRLMKQMLWPDDDKAVTGKTVVKGVPNITHNALLKEIEKLKQDRGIIWNESNRPRLSGTGVDTVAMRNKKAFIETLRPKSIATTFDKDGMAGMGSPSPASPTTSPGHRSRHKFSAAGTPSLAGSIDKLESLQAVITELDSNGLASPRSPTDQASPSHRRDSSGSMKPLPMPPSKRQTISFNDIKQTQLSSSKPLREALMESIRQQRKDGDGDAKEEDTEQATVANIVLSRLKQYSSAEIRQAILSVDHDMLTEPLLRQLATFTPTAEERVALAKYTDDPSELARADAFMIEAMAVQIMKIDRYEQRLQAMNFRKTFEERFADIDNAVEAVHRASTDLQKSRTFPKILEVILMMGNYMNGQGFRGNAQAIKIHSINRLIDTKAEDGKTTLLHFLATVLENKFPDLLTFMDELVSLGDARQVAFTELNLEYNEMSMRITEIVTELQQHYDKKKSTSPDDAFGTVMKISFMMMAVDDDDDVAPYALTDKFTAS
ncbi:formin homology 2 domain-containing protein [Syncephalis pseudoplumigaleata]|uniref:Formin homology 2 domain-containing protein n=1 Tax=Syncephalis pseudoplumigaleata TaxID=1712513 RepID=A0A4P9YYI8_9FUNG|nr:formin homology 2 domain-containing protein [Syncephalis pseudoplumigaleata]|eukprot:RKP24070.1 formin homology 2 domain-containing protein [Syncephalis pseudoplumigaleata]